MSKTLVTAGVPVSNSSALVALPCRSSRSSAWICGGSSLVLLVRSVCASSNIAPRHSRLSSCGSSLVAILGLMMSSLGCGRLSSSASNWS
eukprot:scaffold92048_cov69-Phaeocystis_antarctica.AAC.3